MPPTNGLFGNGAHRQRKCVTQKHRSNQLERHLIDSAIEHARALEAQGQVEAARNLLRNTLVTVEVAARDSGNVHCVHPQLVIEYARTCGKYDSHDRLISLLLAARAEFERNGQRDEMKQVLLLLAHQYWRSARPIRCLAAINLIFKERFALTVDEEFRVHWLHSLSSVAIGELRAARRGLVSHVLPLAQASGQRQPIIDALLALVFVEHIYAAQLRRIDSVWSMFPLPQDAQDYQAHWAIGLGYIQMLESVATDSANAFFARCWRGTYAALNGETKLVTALLQGYEDGLRGLTSADMRWTTWTNIGNAYRVAGLDDMCVHTLGRMRATATAGRYTIRATTMRVVFHDLAVAYGKLGRRDDEAQARREYEILSGRITEGALEWFQQGAERELFGPPKTGEQLVSEQPRYPRALRIALETIHANAHVPLDIEQLCREAAASRRKLEQLFKLHLQTSPARYTREFKLARARQLVRTTSFSLHQISKQLAYSTPSKFASDYHRHFGVPPSKDRSED